MLRSIAPDKGWSRGLSVKQVRDMPVTPSEYADILRTVGRILDEEGAQAFELTNQEFVLTLAWERTGLGPEHREYREQDIAQLRVTAKEQRSGVQYDPVGSIAELLRTVGQELDYLRADITSIALEGDSLIVSGSIRGRYTRQKYLTSALRQSSRTRRGKRRRAKGAPTPAPETEPSPPPPTRPDDQGPLATRIRR